MKIYFLSGLGADETAFQMLTLPGIEAIHLNWMSPYHKESMEGYAARMAERISEPNPVIIGLSFGGMMAIEISKIIPVKQLILISSAKSRRELPFWFTLCRYVPFHKVLPLQAIGMHPKIMMAVFGVRNAEQQKQLQAIIQNSTRGFNQWAIDKVVNWRNRIYPRNLVHIHGQADKLLPCQYVNPNHTIANGGHFMIVNNAAEISAIIMHTLVKQS